MGSLDPHHMQLACNAEQRAMIEQAADTYGMTNTGFVLAVLLGAINHHNIEPLIRSGEKYITSTQARQRRGTGGSIEKSKWKNVAKQHYVRGDWIMLKTASFRKSARSQDDWWHLFHALDQSVNVPLAFRINDAVRLAEIEIEKLERKMLDNH